MIQNLILGGLFWAYTSLSTFKSLEHKKEPLISVYIQAQILKLFPHFLLIPHDKVLRQPASNDSLSGISNLFF